MLFLSLLPFLPLLLRAGFLFCFFLFILLYIVNQEHSSWGDKQGVKKTNLSPLCESCRPELSTPLLFKTDLHIQGHPRQRRHLESDFSTRTHQGAKQNKETPKKIQVTTKKYNKSFQRGKNSHSRNSLKKKKKKKDILYIMEFPKILIKETSWTATWHKNFRLASMLFLSIS